MTTLPDGILNKKECGCGATHLALTNDEDMIVTVPTVELIMNKTKQLSNVFGVYGAVTYDSFKAYLATRTGAIKIMVTYDSLPKVMNWLSYNLVELDTMSLVVDEYHKLLTAYSYRS